MRSAVLSVAVVMITATAVRADDAMFVTAGGSVGIGSAADGQNHFGTDYEPEGTLQARLAVSWERPPLPYKEPRGYRWRGALVPEIMLGYVYVNDLRTRDPDDNTDAFVALGGRAELAFSQHKGGLLEVSGRGGVYLAARVGLLTDADHTPMAELAGGEYLWLGDRMKLGFELGAARFFGEQYQVFANARAPWRDGDGQYVSVHLTAYMSWRL